MGQKVNPIALRLKTTNKNFASCWYSDTSYSALLSQELKARAYLKELMKQIHYPNPIASLSFTPKRVKALMLYLNPAELRRSRSERFQLSASSIVPRIKTVSPGLPLGDPNQRRLFPLSSINSMLLNSRGGTYASSTGVDKRDGPTITHTAISNKPKGIAPTLLSTLLENDRSTSHIRGRKIEIRPVVYYTLLSLACQKMRVGHVLSQRDFEFLNKIRRFLWFQGRWESCLLGVINRRSNVTPIKPGRKPRNNTRERPIKSSQTLGASTPLYKTLTKGKRDIGVGSFSINRPFTQASNALSSPPLPRSLQMIPHLGSPLSAHRFTTSVNIFNSISSKEARSKVIYELLTPHRLEVPHRERDDANQLSLLPIKTSANNSQLSRPTSKPLGKALIDQNKELFRRGRQLRLACIESTLSRGLGASTTLYLYRSVQEEQTAQFLSGEIAFYLERRVPFRRIKQALIRDLQKEYIEGVRVRCSGRVGGRSKKAQRAKEDGFQWGQTSSHVFSSKLSFDSRSALTPLGKIGIKVWVCFK